MFDNIVMDRPGEQDNVYDAPTKQMVVIRGQNSIETITLPHLNTYYNNLQMPGRNYAYFQVTHFDFPMCDSLTKMVGSYVDLEVVIFIDQLNEGSPSWSSLFNDTVLPAGMTTTTVNLSFRMNLRRISSPEDIAAMFRNKISTCWDFPTISNNIRVLLAYYTDFSYDPVGNKFVITYSKPQTSQFPVLSTATNDICRIMWNITSRDEGSAAQLLANCFGGQYGNMPIGWTTKWIAQIDTGFTFWFRRQRQQSIAINGITVPDLAAMTRSEAVLEARSSRAVRLYKDTYIYIRGAPEQSIWGNDGESTDILAVLPRNRPAGMPPSTLAYVAETTHKTKTTIGSLRSMSLRITDEAGDLIKFDDDYILKIGIEFQL